MCKHVAPAASFLCRAYKVNVGGMIFSVGPQSIKFSNLLMELIFCVSYESGSMQPPQDENGNLFLDESPEDFKLLLQYLRKGEIQFNSVLYWRDEADISTKTMYTLNKAKYLYLPLITLIECYKCPLPRICAHCFALFDKNRSMNTCLYHPGELSSLEYENDSNFEKVLTHSCCGDTEGSSLGCTRTNHEELRCHHAIRVENDENVEQTGNRGYCDLLNAEVVCCKKKNENRHDCNCTFCSVQDSDSRKQEKSPITDALVDIEEAPVNSSIVSAKKVDTSGCSKRYIGEIEESCGDSVDIEMQLRPSQERNWSSMSAPDTCDSAGSVSIYTAVQASPTNQTSNDEDLPFSTDTTPHPAAKCHDKMKKINPSQDFCNFLKPISPQYKTRMCPYFKHGLCRRDAQSCKFAHSLQELRATNEFFKTQLCVFWLGGYCRAGADCRHAHGPSDIRATKNEFYAVMPQEDASIHRKVKQNQKTVHGGTTHFETATQQSYECEAAELPREVLYQQPNANNLVGVPHNIEYIALLPVHRNVSEVPTVLTQSVLSQQTYSQPQAAQYVHGVPVETNYTKVVGVPVKYDDRVPTTLS